ncbi:hypothetical protein GCM10022408_17910 [Hymenobacter fastidiosus]|uniref:Uncharacterized protein n=1 Tax=Hymenobacter fastidiosus TaxID=486264 RepID=A0ABP7S4H3_9BACT
MRAYLLLRLRILGRQLAELGWVRLVLLGALVVLAAGKLIELLLTTPATQWAWPAFGLLWCWSVHRQRTDLDFLRIASPHLRSWLLAEYALWLVPGWGILLGLGHFGAALLMLAAVPLVLYLPQGQPGTKGRRRRSLLRSEAFEWVSGFRQLGGGLVWSVGLAAAVWQPVTVVPAVVLGAWSLFVTYCYTIPEPLTMLTLYGAGPRAFRRRKLGLALLLYLLTAAPFGVLMALGPATWAGAAGLLGWGLVVVSMSVMAKYSFYPHATLVRLTQGGVVAVALLPLLNSSYTPLLVAVFLVLIWKSHQHLKPYWND